MNKWLRTIALALLVFGAFPALGQELFVDIDASTNTPGLNESFTLTYTLKMKRNNGSVSFQHRGIDVSRPPFEGFSKIDEGVGNPSFTFGGFDQDMDLYIYQVVLKPLEKGKFKIPPVSFIVNDTKISSKEFEIHVGNKVNIPKKAGDADLFVSIDLSKTEVYVGEPVTAVYKIYLKKGNIVETEALEFPQYSGFWVESYEQETQWQNKVINGVRYQYIEVKRDVLFPQRAGEFELEDFLFAGLVKYRVQSNSFFPQYKTERLSDKSGKKKIRVKPLPTGQPDNFMGSFAGLKVEVKATPQELETNQAITLTTKFSGSGNLKLLQEVPFEFPTDFEVYDPETKDKFSVTPTTVSGSRSHEYVILVRNAGEFVVPGLDLSYFDYKSKSYKKLSLDTQSFKVIKGETSDEDLAYTFNGKNQVNILNQDIRFIQSNPDCLRLKSYVFFGSGLYYGLLSLPLLGFAAFLFLMKRKEDEENDEAGFRQKKAGRVAKQHLSKAAELAKNADESPFYEELSKALYGYLADKFGMQISELSKAGIRSRLASIISSDLIDGLIGALETCDMARYAPVSGQSRDELLKRAQEIIEQIEKSSS